MPGDVTEILLDNRGVGGVQTYVAIANGMCNWMPISGLLDFAEPEYESVSFRKAKENQRCKVTQQGQMGMKCRKFLDPKDAMLGKTCINQTSDVRKNEDHVNMRRKLVLDLLFYLCCLRKAKDYAFETPRRCNQSRSWTLRPNSM